MTVLRCDVCGCWMDHVTTSIPYGWAWRCPNEGLVWHVESELSGRVSEGTT